MDLIKNTSFKDRTILKLYKLQFDIDYRILFDYASSLYSVVITKITEVHEKHIFICCLLLVCKYCIDETVLLNERFHRMYFIDKVQLKSLELNILSIIDFNIYSFIENNNKNKN